MAKIASKVITSDGVLFKFTDGKELMAKVADIPKDVRERLMLHGLSQKIGDSYSGAENVKEAMQSAQAVYAGLVAGQFNSGRSSTGGIVVEAIARIKGISVDQAGQLWEALDEDARETIGKKPQVRAMINVIKGERAQGKLVMLSDEDEDLGI